MYPPTFWRWQSTTLRARMGTAGTDFDSQLGSAEYEIKGKMENGTVVEVDVSPEGKVHEIETAIPAVEVPAPVTKLLNAYLPGFTPTLTEKSARPDGVNFYEFEGKRRGCRCRGECRGH